MQKVIPDFPNELSEFEKTINAMASMKYERLYKNQTISFAEYQEKYSDGESSLLTPEIMYYQYTQMMEEISQKLQDTEDSLKILLQVQMKSQPKLVNKLNKYLHKRAAFWDNKVYAGGLSKSKRELAICQKGATLDAQKVAEKFTAENSKNKD